MNEELKIIISAEISKLQQGIENAKQKVKSLQGKFAEAKKTIKEDLAAAGESATNVAKKIGAGFAAIGAALVATAASTEEYRNQQAQLITAFEAAGASASVAKDTYNDLYRVLGDGGQAQEAAQHLAKLTTEEKALSEWTTIAQGVYATFGASLPIESLTEAANETAKTGSLTGALADALNWAGVSEEAFQAKLDACNTEAEREAIIRETLNGLYSNAAATYEANNAQVLAQRDAQAKLQETLAKVGEAIAPVITAFTTFGAEILEKITPYIIDLAEKFMPKLQEILTKVADAIGAVITWVVDNWELVKTIGTVILSIVAAFTALSTIMSIVNGVMTIMAMNPIVLAISALVAVIALCILNWDKIKEAATKAWEGIKAAWGKVADWFKGVAGGIKNAFSNIGGWFSEKFTAARSGVEKAFDNIGNWFSDKFTKAKAGIEKAWSGIKDWAGKSYKNITDSFVKVDSYMSDKFGSAWQGIKNAFTPFVSYFQMCWNTVKNIFSAVKSVLSGNFSDAWQSIKNVFSGWGQFFTNLWNNIKQIFSNVGTAIGGAIKNTVATAVNKVLSVATGIINGFISAINFAIDVINAIPGVNIRRLDKLSVPQMAKGGVVDSATLAVIGERGKEAVVPLENNLEWLDKLAAMLNDRMGGGNVPIVLNVDGNTFAKTAINTINSHTRQTGKLGLEIV